MTKWELSSYYKSIRAIDGSYVGSDPSVIWTNKDKKTGKTSWDELKAMAADGWELVSVTPIAAGASGTDYLPYTFKRPKT
jgi:hypothetical protein